MPLFEQLLCAWRNRILVQSPFVRSIGRSRKRRLRTVDTIERLEERTLLASVTVSFQNGVNNYNDTIDARILGDNVTRNDGNSATMQSHGNPDRASLIRWDVSSIAANSVVEAASITLNVTEKSTQAYELYALLRPWVENQVSWNLASSGNNWTTAGAQGATDRNATVLGAITAPNTGLITVQLNAAGIARIQEWVNSPASNHGIIIQDYANTDGLELSSSEATTAANRPKLTITYGTGSPPTNNPPIAVANSYSVTRGSTLMATDINGSTATTNDDSVLRDDSDPDGNPITASIVTGPTQSSAFTFNTNGTFNYTPNSGTSTSDSFTYRVSDGANFSNTVTVSIMITNPTPTNQPPAVEAGTDQTVSLAAGVSLDGTVTDDNLPAPPGTVTTAWSRTSGPGTVTFASASSVDTTASFSVAGTYVLRLTASDGAETRFDDVTVTVQNVATGGVTLSFQDGVNGYSGTTDSRIRSDSPTKNDGSLTTFQSHGNPDRASLIRWDLSSVAAGSTVQSASITLNVTDKSTQAYELYALLRPWIENQVTWNQATNGNSWGTAGAQNASDKSATVLGSITAPNAGLVTIELNAAGIAQVQAWVNNPATNNGLIIQDYGNGDGLEISSSEAATAAQRPKLTIMLAEDRVPKLQKIVEGLHLYHEIFGEFPVDEVPSLYAGTASPFLSWRVHILPFIGHGELYQQFHLDEAWDSAHNLTLINQMPDLFRSRGLNAGTTLSGFRMLQGNGAFEYGYGLGNAFDGAQHTLLVLETMAQNASVWTRPDELPFNAANPLAGLTLPSDSFLVATVDGKIKQIKPTVAPATFAAFATWNGNEILSSAQYASLYTNWDADDSVAASTAKLKQLILGMHNVHDAQAAFPPGTNVPADWFDPTTGKPYLSWRVHLLPVMGYSDLYNQFHFNEAWNSAHNIQLLDKMPEEFRSRGLAPGSTSSAFKLITGPEAYAVRNLSPGTGSRGARIADADDGLQSTIGIVELTADKAVPWTQWNEVDYSAANPLSGIGTIPAGGLRVAMLDGSVRTLNPAATAANFGIFATWNSGELFGPTESSNVFLDWTQADTKENRAEKLFDVALAMHNYHDTFNHFPTAGPAANWNQTTKTPNLSWRVQLLPYLGYEDLYSQFHLNEAWNSPHNLTLLDKMPEVFRTRGLAADSHLTALKLFVGGGAYTYRTTNASADFWSGPRISDARDGLDITIGAIELLADQAIEWTRPDDINFDPANPLAGIGTIPTDGLLVFMMDGTIRTINPAVTAQNFKMFVDWNGVDVHGYAETSNVFLDWQEPSIRTSTGISQLDVQRTSANKLKQFMLAFYNFYDAYLRFPIPNIASNWNASQSTPTNGVPNLSWRVHILPFLGYQDLYEQFHLNETWDSPHNIQLLNKMPEILRSRGLPADTTQSGFQLFMAPEAYKYTPFDGGYQGPRMNTITDGTANTIAMIETLPEDAREWTRPDSDIVWNAANPYGSLTIPPDYFLAAMFDGSVRNINPLLDDAIFKAFITFAAGDVANYPVD